MIPVYGRRVAIEFNESLKRYVTRVRNMLHYATSHGRLTDNVFRTIKRKANESSREGNLTVSFYRGVFAFLRIKDYEAMDVVGLEYILLEKLGDLGYARMYLHTPIRYDVNKEIAAVLHASKRYDFEDRYGLVVGSVDPRFYGRNIKPTGTVNGYEVWESERYRYVLADKEYCEAHLHLWLKYYDPLLCPIEMYYPAKSVLVFAKYEQAERVPLLMAYKRLKDVGWTQSEDFKVLFEWDDCGILNGGLVVGRYDRYTEISKEHKF